MKTYKFNAIIEAGPGGGAFVTFPYDTKEEFATKGAVKVKATFNGVPYAGSLMACGGPYHLLGILKSIRQQTGKNIGDSIEVKLWKDEHERTVEIPAPFKERMKQEGLLPFFESLSYTNRKEYCRWITSAKTEETNAKRFAKAIEMLKSGIKTPG
jgi:hypothetical protein